MGHSQPQKFPDDWIYALIVHAVKSSGSDLDCTVTS